MVDIRGAAAFSCADIVYWVFKGLLAVSESSRMDGATHARLAYNCDGCIMD